MSTTEGAKPPSDTVLNASVRPAEGDSSQYKINHITMRCKDPRRTIEFYTGTMGMKYLHRIHFPFAKVTSYFLGYANQEEIPKNTMDRQEWVFTRPAVLEFIHEWGAEDNPDIKYHPGNTKPHGYGHIGIHVPDIDRTVNRLLDKNVRVVKKTNQGSLNNLGYAEDPDGYRFEIMNPDGWRNMVIPEKASADHVRLN